MAMDLGKQIGPLPLGAWVAVVAGGLGIALWTKQNKNSNADPEIVEDTSGDDGVGTGPSWTAVPPPTYAPGATTYETNEQWATAAINWLIAQGYDPGLVNSAITKAIAGGTDIEGNKMSWQEWALWALALAKFGSPPYPVNVQPPGAIPPVDPPPPPPDTTTPPPATGTVPAHFVETAKHGDTISKLAAKHGKTWQETWAFNLKYRNAATAAIMKARGPNLIFAGTTIWVPK